MAKNIVICVDGTWNDPTEHTNAYKLFRALVAGNEISEAGDDAIGRAQEAWIKTKVKGTLAGAESFWDQHDDLPIRMVGVWDTVGALGIPIFNGMRVFDRIEKHLQ